MKARIIPVQGEAIDALLAKADYYSAAPIPGGLYPGVDAAVPSIGGKAVLATTSKTDPEVVYQLVKSVFDNLERFKRLHPAFAELQAEDMIRVGLTAPCMRARNVTTGKKAGCDAAARRQSARDRLRLRLRGSPGITQTLLYERS